MSNLEALVLLMLHSSNNITTKSSFFRSILNYNAPQLPQKVFHRVLLFFINDEEMERSQNKSFSINNHFSMVNPFHAGFIHL